ncbi:hypothetical protein LJ707_02690 [Mucilaginibacter sp. UR6-1]|uniref:hypothetical protein n=1 Tax=Mucilaginibacter sp. UR6-1 TaxID=1435643 RepID=UPI001E3F1657|nr:hypothetical protein [Mucilaginibacter sp. UR6-1]MCC8407819.1 hypothetical protein [Mucilaginibacter sp. UR6-1]
MKSQFKFTGIYSSKLPLVALLSASLFMASCKKDSGVATPEGNFNRSSKALYPDTRTPGGTVVTVSGVLTGTINWTAGNTYRLNGPVYIDSLATLNIAAGTFVKGLDKTNTTTGFPSYLVIRRGGKLNINGTATNPVVFTSQYAAGSRAEGDWGGIVILGRAPVNNVNPKIEGIPAAQIPAALAGKDAIGYGGAIEADNSGSIRYLRIEFAGEVITEGNELNGLTLGGVGSGTTLDHVQVSYGADDAFEFFGGSVNATNLISYLNDDDDFDFDQGYQGSIQFAVAQKDPRTAFPRSGNPNGIESNNITSPIVTGGAFSTRLTTPVLSNFSILGDTSSTTAPSVGVGTVFRVGSSGVFKNSVVGGFATGANVSTADATLIYTDNLVHYFTTSGVPSGNTTYTGSASNPFRLHAPYNITTPEWRFNNVSPLLSPARNGWNATGLTVSHPGGALSAFTNTTYRGAFGDRATTTRWDGPASGSTSTWASYEPTTNTY